jgi:transcriptional regulator with XRE-family HTH domain
MNELSNLWMKLSRSKRYRGAFTASVAKRMIPVQIRVLMKQRGWSQARLAMASNLTQGVISRAQDPEYGNLTINTLVKIASGFDCAYVGRFVPFSELGRWYTTLAHEAALRVPSFIDDCEPIERKAPHLASSVTVDLMTVNRIGSTEIRINNELNSKAIIPINREFYTSATFTTKEGNLYGQRKHA